MTRQELNALSRAELMQIAKETDISGRSKMTRVQLIEALDALAGQPSDDPDGSQPLETKEIRGVEAATPAGVVFDQYQDPPLPGPYHDTRITLLARDPYWLHAYWDLSPESREDATRRFGDWANIPLNLRVFEAPGEQPARSAGSKWFDVPVSPWSQSWYIYVGDPGTSYYVQLGYLLPHRFETVASSNTVSTPRDSVSPVVDEEWMVVDEHFRRLYQLAGLPGGASEALVGGYLQRLERETQAGSGAVSSITSPGLRHAMERRFWLVLNTEIVVYGATEPGALIHVNGEPVELRPDGTFAMRLSLPDGIHKLPVSAQSSNGSDTITITPVITKQTV